MRDARGFVLVNALVLVAALSAVAVLLLTRAEGGRARLETGLTSAQLTLNLDAFDALALTLLARDTGETDHSGDSWANVGRDVPLERGRVAGQITDLQGRFNVNWLTDDNNAAAQAAFDRLLDHLGVPSQAGQTIRDLLRPQGPEDPGPWRRRVPPEDPVGGALLMGDQLADIPGLNPRVLARLRPYLTAIPGDSALNVNTVSVEVLAAFLPNLSSAALGQMISNRTQAPFLSVEAFLATVGIILPEDDDPEAPPPALNPDHLSVGSEWFALESRATLDERQARRRAVLHRLGPPGQIDLVWQVTVRP